MGKGGLEAEANGVGAQPSTGGPPTDSSGPHLLLKTEEGTEPARYPVLLVLEVLSLRRAGWGYRRCVSK